MENKVVVKGGLSFGTIFFIVLFILKVCKVGTVANWSWLWITAPLWGGIAIWLIILLMTFIVGFVAILIETLFNK